MEDEIPPAILAKHPEMAEVAEALKAEREGRVVTTRCRRCGQLIRVTQVAATGALIAACDRGCTYFHAQRAKGAPPAGGPP